MMSSHLFYPSYFSSALLLLKLLVSQASHFLQRRICASSSQAIPDGS